jgi:hypothetical protein
MCGGWAWDSVVPVSHCELCLGSMSCLDLQCTRFGAWACLCTGGVFCSLSSLWGIHVPTAPCFYSPLHSRLANVRIRVGLTPGRQACGSLDCTAEGCIQTKRLHLRAGMTHAHIALLCMCTGCESKWQRSRGRVWCLKHTAQRLCCPAGTKESLCCGMPCCAVLWCGVLGA